MGCRPPPCLPASDPGARPWSEQWELERGRGMIAALEQPLLLVDPLEQVAVLADVLRRAQEKVSARPEREVEDRDHAPLELGAEIDQQVAAGGPVDARRPV